MNPEGDSDGGTEVVDRTGVGLQEGPAEQEGRDWAKERMIRGPEGV